MTEILIEIALFLVTAVGWFVLANLVDGLFEAWGRRRERLTPERVSQVTQVAFGHVDKRMAKRLKRLKKLEADYGDLEGRFEDLCEEVDRLQKKLKKKGSK